MGCVTARDLSEEETTITRAEDALGYGQSHAFRHDAIFRKYASNGELNDRQFKDAADILRIVTTKTAELDKVDELYQKFRAEDSTIQPNPSLGKYRLKRLLVLSLLLGGGSAKEKAKLLFEIYDADAVHTLSSQHIVKMITKLFYVSVQVLPILALKPDRTRVNNYVENLKLTKIKAVEELVKLILDKSISVEKEKFISTFDHSEVLKHVLTSFGFRDFCHTVYKSNPSPWYLAPRKDPPVIQKAQGGAGVVTQVTTEKTVVRSEVQASEPVKTETSAAPKSLALAPTASSTTPPASSTAQTTSSSAPQPEASSKNPVL